MAVAAAAAVEAATVTRYVDPARSSEAATAKVGRAATSAVNATVPDSPLTLHSKVTASVVPLPPPGRHDPDGLPPRASKERGAPDRMESDAGPVMMTPRAGVSAFRAVAVATAARPGHMA